MTVRLIYSGTGTVHVDELWIELRLKEGRSALRYKSIPFDRDFSLAAPEPEPP